MRVSKQKIKRFRDIIYGFYGQESRDYLPWRNTDDPYHILVSEIMLQQTRIERVVQKYPILVERFPDFSSLARARLRSLYSVWYGMGYNRRALALKKIASIIIKAPYHGRLPSEVDDLMNFPSVGRATACAIAAFAFHQPVVFIETNIRRVFIHFFFPSTDRITDRDILPLVEKTLDVRDPRKWYYALMDYGSMLRSLPENPNRKSTTYKKQSPFSGSNRQVRGQILKLLIKNPRISLGDITRQVNIPCERVLKTVDQLQKEGFIRKKGNLLCMA